MEIDTELRERSASSAQFLVFNLFADYIVPYRQGRVWTQELLYLLGLLGMSERAVRTTLSRMKARGWFTTRREGRQSRYELTERGHAILDEGGKRIFEPVIGAWDGRWHLVVYSLPEEKRAQRNELRKKLTWFGFGNLAPGTWVGVHDRSADLAPIVAELEVGDYVSLFEAQPAGFITDAEIVAKCWDLDALRADYETFIGRWQPRYEAFRADPAQFSPETGFLLRFWLTFDFQPFPRRDPNLPAALLPAGWPGHTARRLFNDFRAHLETGLAAFFADLPV